MQHRSTPSVKPQRTVSATAANKKLGRARTTNDPARLPLANSRRAQERRRRDLVAIYIDALGGSVTPLQAIEIRKAAELTTAAETARARLLAGNAAIDLNALVKIEGEARRAVRALDIKSQPRVHVPLRERLAAEAAGAT